jgi:hypothetical protein
VRRLQDDQGFAAAERLARDYTELLGLNPAERATA